MEEVHDVVHESVTKTMPEKKKCKKTKWLFEEALHIAEKRREAKRKGEKERYIQQNSELQRTARGDTKAFLNEQCKEIEENNRMLIDNKHLFLSLLEAGKSKALANSVRIW